MSLLTGVHCPNKHRSKCFINLTTSDFFQWEPELVGEMMKFIRKLPIMRSKRKYTLDNDIKSIIRPFYLFHMFFSTRKFRIDKSFITTVTAKDILSTLGVNIINISLMYLETLSILPYYQSVLFQIFFVITYSQYVLNFAVVSLSNVCHSKTNVRLILTLQSINRLLYNKDDISKLKIIICVSFAAFITLHCSVIIAKCYLDPLWHLSRAFLYIITLPLDIEMIYINVVAYYLACKIKRWNEVMKLTGYFNQAVEEPEEAIVKDIMLKAYYELIDGFFLMQQLFKFRILFHVITVFIQCMISVSIVIFRMNIGSFSVNIEPNQLWNVRLSHIIGLGAVISKALVLLTTLCASCETVSLGVQDAKTIVTIGLSLQESLKSRRIAKNLRRVSATGFSALNACGVFTVNAALPLRVGALLATYTIVILQFAFL